MNALMAGLACAAGPALLWAFSSRAAWRSAALRCLGLAACATVGAWLAGQAPWAERAAGSVQLAGALGGVAFWLVAACGVAVWRRRAPRRRLGSH